MKSVNWLIFFEISPYIVFLVLCGSQLVSSVAPPTYRQVKYEPHGGGSDYLELEEDDEFPEESIAFLRSMAQSFRGGFAKAMNQGSSAADSAKPPPNGSEPAGDSGESSGSGEDGQTKKPTVMSYITQIWKGFQAIGKSIAEMFQTIAAKGGERLAKRVQNRMNKWAQNAPTPSPDSAKKMQDAASPPPDGGEPPNEPKPF